MATPKPESKLRNKMIARIRALGCPSEARAVHGSPNQRRGEPDIDAVVCGMSVKVEVKMPGNEPTPVQAAVMRKWAAAGGVVGCAHDVDELDALLRRALILQGCSPENAEHLLRGEPQV